MTAALLSALLSLYHPPAPIRACLDAQRDRIVAQLDEAERVHGVPAVVLIVVAFAESHLGCDAGEGGNWGAPASRTRRHVAGTPDDAARALAWGYRRCRDWPGAVAHFRCGMCRCARLRGYGAATVMRIAGRLRPGPAVAP